MDIEQTTGTAPVTAGAEVPKAQPESEKKYTQAEMQEEINRVLGNKVNKLNATWEKKLNEANSGKKTAEERIADLESQFAVANEKAQRAELEKVLIGGGVKQEHLGYIMYLMKEATPEGRSLSEVPHNELLEMLKKDNPQYFGAKEEKTVSSGFRMSGETVQGGTVNEKFNNAWRNL